MLIIFHFRNVPYDDGSTLEVDFPIMFEVGLWLMWVDLECLGSLDSECLCLFRSTLCQGWCFILMLKVNALGSTVESWELVDISCVASGVTLSVLCQVLEPNLGIVPASALFSSPVVCV